MTLFGLHLNIWQYIVTIVYNIDHIWQLRIFSLSTSHIVRCCVTRTCHYEACVHHLITTILYSRSYQGRRSHPYHTAGTWLKKKRIIELTQAEIAAQQVAAALQVQTEWTCNNCGRKSRMTVGRHASPLVNSIRLSFSFFFLTCVTSISPREQNIRLIKATAFFQNFSQKNT